MLHTSAYDRLQRSFFKSSINTVIAKPNAKFGEIQDRYFARVVQRDPAKCEEVANIIKTCNLQHKTPAQAITSLASCVGGNSASTSYSIENQIIAAKDNCTDVAKVISKAQSLQLASFKSPLALQSNNVSQPKGLLLKRNTLFLRLH